jgi:hypothetical protein
MCVFSFPHFLVIRRTDSSKTKQFRGVRGFSDIKSLQPQTSLYFETETGIKNPSAG